MDEKQPDNDLESHNAATVTKARSGSARVGVVARATEIAKAASTPTATESAEITPHTASSHFIADELPPRDRQALRTAHPIVPITNAGASNTKM